MDESVVPASVAREPAGVTEGDRPILARIARALEGSRGARLVVSGGETFDLPEPVSQLLRDVVHQLYQGHDVTIVPYERELTTQEAADLLNVSRPFLIRILDGGDIPYRRLGTHRRILLGDLISYKKRRDAQRYEALDRLTELSNELGLYGIALERRE